MTLKILGRIMALAMVIPVAGSLLHGCAPRADTPDSRGSSPLGVDSGGLQPGLGGTPMLDGAGVVTADSSPSTCGTSGKQCCGGTRCANGGCCVSGICMLAGAVCVGLGGGVCQASSCGTCGGAGQPCCISSAGASVCTAPDTICSGGSCGRCGNLGDTCCAGNQCNSGCCSAGRCLAVTSGACSARDASVVAPDSAPGGALGTGSISGAGGVTGKGGMIGAGGATVIGRGGSLASGGVIGSGGSLASGGVVGRGGNLASGGMIGTGGSSATGGVTSTGGTLVPTTSPAVAYHGSLRVVGSKVVNSRGEAMQLRGMSLFWSQWMGQYWNHKAIDWLVADWKVTVVRAAMGIETATGDIYNPAYLDDPEANLSLLRTVVDAAIADGIYVIIDWHDHNAPLHQLEAESFFSSMAQTYGGYPNVIYEIFNEPPPTYSWADIKSYAAGVIVRIREHDPDNLIVVPTPSWDQDVDEAAADPLAGTNLAYSVHFYAGEPSHQAPLRAKVQTALGLGLPLFATEWGTPDATGDGTISLSQSDTWLELLRANDISWCNWSIADKDEAASALKPDASATGGWSPSQLTASGTYIRDTLLAGAAKEPWIVKPDAGAPPDTVNPTTGLVTIVDGQAQGAMTGYGWVTLGELDTITDPICLDPYGPIVDGLSCLDTLWSSSNALCVSGTIPAVATPEDWENNWGIYISVPASTDAAGTLGQAFSSIAVTATGSPTTGLRVLVHRRGDLDSKLYCAPLALGSYVPLTSLNTACWDGSGDDFAASDVPNIDLVILAVPSATTAISVDDLCLTSISFK